MKVGAFFLLLGVNCPGFTAVVEDEVVVVVLAFGEEDFVLLAVFAGDGDELRIADVDLLDIFLGSEFTGGCVEATAAAGYIPDKNNHGDGDCHNDGKIFFYRFVH